MTDDDPDTELQRVAYNLWVLAKMPPGGPEAFHDEARRLIDSRRARDRGDYEGDQGPIA